MDELTDIANKFLESNYILHVHTVAAVLEAKNGKVYQSVNTDHFSSFVCAETAALSMAINAGETEFSKIVAVRREKDGSEGVANPCGKCRQIFHDYAPGIEFAVSDGNAVIFRTVEDLLPYSFTYTRQKIKDALQHKSDEVAA